MMHFCEKMAEGERRVEVGGSWGTGVLVGKEQAAVGVECETECEVGDLKCLG